MGREVPRREPDLERLGEAADPAEVGLERDRFVRVLTASPRPV